MTEVWFLAAVWIGLALIAVLIAIKFRISTALSEIVVGTVAQLIIGAVVGTTFLGAQQSWITFLAGAGAIVLTFLAGAEIAIIFWGGKDSSKGYNRNSERLLGDILCVRKLTVLRWQSKMRDNCRQIYNQFMKLL